MSTITLHTARDLGAAVRGLRPDALALGIKIADDWCRDQMHDLGVTRYEDVDADVLHAIADRVDSLDRPAAIEYRLVEDQIIDAVTEQRVVRGRYATRADAIAAAVTLFDGHAPVGPDLRVIAVTDPESNEGPAEWTSAEQRSAWLRQR